MSESTLYGVLTVTELWNGATYVTTSSEVMTKRYDYRNQNVSVKLGNWRNPTAYYRAIGTQWAPSVQIRSEKVNRFTGAKSYTGTATGYVGGSGYSLLPSLATNKFSWVDLNDQCVIKALAKFSDGPIDIGVLLGERRESLEFLSDTAERAFGMMKAVKRRDVKAIKQSLRIQEGSQRHYRSVLHEVADAPTDLWLSSALAVKPMVADAYGVMEALETKEQAEPPMKKAVATVKDLVPYEYNSSAYLLGNYFLFKAAGDIELLVKVRFDAEMRNDLLFRLSQVGVANPLSLAWNLLPLSFVADYFGNVGDYFQASGSTVGLKFKAGSITNTAKRRIGWKYDGLGPNSWGSTWVPGAVSCLVTHFPKTETATDRGVYSAFPSALTDYAPRLMNKLNPTRLLTVSSLMAQFTK